MRSSLLNAQNPHAYMRLIAVYCGIIVSLASLACKAPDHRGAAPVKDPVSPVGAWRRVFEEGQAPFHEATFVLLFLLDDGTAVQVHRPLVQVNLKVDQEAGLVRTTQVDPAVILAVGKWSREGQAVRVMLPPKDSDFELRITSNTRLDPDLQGSYFTRLKEGVLEWSTPDRTSSDGGSDER